MNPSNPMSTYKWGRSSLERLTTCSQGIRAVCNRALSYGITDISVICGHRSQEAQTSAFNQGVSCVQWPDSMHNAVPSVAVDIYPYHPRFKLLTGHPDQVRAIARDMKWTTLTANSFILCEFHRMAGVIFAAAKEEGVELRWGGDWDSDGDTTDQTFMDLCHFEEA